MATDTERIDVTKLPARPPLDGEFGPVPPIDQISEGDVVAIYSRGAERVALVESVGKSSLRCVYTTKGAWDTAQRTYERLSDPNYVWAHVDYAKRMAAQNYDYYVRELNPDTAKHGKYRTEDELQEMRVIVALGCDQYAKREAQKAREKAQAEYDGALRDGAGRYVTITHKTTKLTDVRGWRKS